jgi:hypothetical protein
MADSGRKNDSNAPLPQIPDGGLTQSMPDWLRRPPAWKTLKGEDEEEGPERDFAADRVPLPDADTSPIDPGTLISVEDLPSWLHGFGRAPREEALPQSEPVTRIGDDVGETKAVSQDTAPEQSKTDVRAETASSSSPTHESDDTYVVAGSEMDSSLSSAPIERRRKSAGRRCWSGNASAVAILALLLVVAVTIIVVLLVA